MKRISLGALAGVGAICVGSALLGVAAASSVDLRAVVEVNAGQAIGQLRVVPVSLGEKSPKALLAVLSGDAEVDPYTEMFFFPKDTLKLMAFTADAKVLWKRDLGRGVVPGIWFCPVFPFDLDGDGADEIWFVDNPDADHPLTVENRRLERLDGRTGEVLGQWPWSIPDSDQSPSHLFRHFILGGHARGRPVLVTAQGTYGIMALQAWNPDMSRRWEIVVSKDSPGARGSHQCAVADLDGDGTDEVLWGERAISLDTGRELFCADRDVYRGHSDVVQPVLDSARQHWLLYTCRESGEPPRVVAFDGHGKRLWSDIDRGHMDVGWVATREASTGEKLALAIRIGAKSAGPQGFARKGVEEFVYDVFSGAKMRLPFSLFGTLPVDANGDGTHELVRGSIGGDGALLNWNGAVLGKVDGPVVHVSKVLDRPGEQIVTYTANGSIKVWADLNARDSTAALSRYQHPAYRANQRLTACGYNLVNLGGL